MIWVTSVACLFLMLFFLDGCACFKQDSGIDAGDCEISLTIPFDWTLA